MTSIIRKMKEEARCCECRDVMMEPVTTECGHNFCRQCIEDIIKFEDETSSPGNYACHYCWEDLKKRSLPPNKQLENLIEIIEEMDCALLCDEHGEQLQLFCKDEGQLICWCCERSPQHRGHNTAPMDLVCPGYKEKIQEIVKDLKSHQDHGLKVKLLIRKEITEWEEDIEDQREKIQTEFRNLQNFIQEEEKRYLWRLDYEKDEGLRRLQDHEASVEKQVLEFKSHIQELKKKCYGSPQALMKDVDDMEERFSSVKLKVPEVLCLTPETGSNISELCSNVKKKFQSAQDQLPSKDS